MQTERDGKVQQRAAALNIQVQESNAERNMAPVRQLSKEGKALSSFVMNQMPSEQMERPLSAAELASMPDIIR